MVPCMLRLSLFLWVSWQVICQAVRKHISGGFSHPLSPIGAGTQGVLVQSANAKCIGTCWRESWAHWYVGHLSLFSLCDTYPACHYGRKEGQLSCLHDAAQNWYCFKLFLCCFLSFSLVAMDIFLVQSQKLMSINNDWRVELCAVLLKS